MAVIVRGDEARFPTLALAGELVEEVPGCGELQLHRDDARRRLCKSSGVRRCGDTGGRGRGGDDEAAR